MSMEGKGKHSTNIIQEVRNWRKLEKQKTTGKKWKKNTTINTTQHAIFYGLPCAPEFSEFDAEGALNWKKIW